MLEIVYVGINYLKSKLTGGISFSTWRELLEVAEQCWGIASGIFRDALTELILQDAKGSTLPLSILILEKTDYCTFFYLLVVESDFENFCFVLTQCELFAHLGLSQQIQKLLMTR